MKANTTLEWSINKEVKMKKLFVMTMLAMLALSVSCNRDSEMGTGAGDNMEVQREEEMNRGDMIEDSNYEQRDLDAGTGAAPMEMDSDEIESSEMGTGAGSQVDSDLETGTEVEQE